jgi:hypothetical protein
VCREYLKLWLDRFTLAGKLTAAMHHAKTFATRVSDSTRRKEAAVMKPVIQYSDPNSYVSPQKLKFRGSDVDQTKAEICNFYGGVKITVFNSVC